MKAGKPRTDTFPSCAALKTLRTRARLRHALLLAGTALYALCLAQPALAQTAWNGSGSSDWFTNGNWSSGVPTSSLDANINTITPNPTVVNGGTASTKELNIGVNNKGALTVENGGTLESGRGIIGYFSASEGSVTVTGTGSSWTSTDNLFIGETGKGTLTVENGGLVLNTSGVIGGNDGGKGLVTVTGPDSVWTNTSALYVGYLYGTNTGTLIIENGGEVSNTSGYIGYGANSVGTATVTGENSTWTNSAILFVGNSGKGTLTVEDGGTLTSGQGVIGYGSNSVSTATVTGPNSTWTNSGSLAVGESGKGTLTVEAGGKVSNAGSYIGGFGGSEGMATVSGPGSTWTSSGGALTVGYHANGTLTVQDGGKAESRWGYIGAFVGSEGTATVTGPNSTWTTTDEFYIGYEGKGTLDITGGGVVSNTYAIIADQAGSSGDVTVDGAGSQWNFSSNLAVGNSGDATLAISSGGAVSNVDGLIGYFAAGSSAVTVDGADSTWSNSGELTIGVWGGATLAISDGGAVSSATGYIGRHGTGIGDVTVSGAGSTWTNSDDLYVGESGTGTLGISGGAVEVGGTVIIAGNAASTGTLNIGAASGDAAVAAGTLDAANVQFGLGTGKIVFNHNESGYVFSANISGGGSLLVENGTTILTGANSYSGGTTISAGALIGDTASLQGNIVNNAALVFDQAGTGTFAGVVSGSGSLTKQGAGALTLSADSSGFAGTTTVSGGELIVNGALGGILNMNGGTLGGSGSFGNVILESGAMLAPGNSIGTMNVVNYTFNPGSIYEVELNDAGFIAGTNNDLLNATGTVIINGGTVHVTPENGSDDGSTYTPGTYTIVTAGGGVSGTFDTLTNDYAFLGFTLDYSNPNRVDLISQLTASSFCLTGMSANECAAGEGAFSLGGGNSVFDAVLGLSNTEAPMALNLLSGEVHASGQHVINQTFSLFSRTLTGQASAGISGGMAGGQVFTASLGYGPSTLAGSSVTVIDGATTSAYADARVAQAWLAPLGGRGVVDADGNAGELDWWTLGLAGGYESPIDVASGNAWAGFGLGYLRSNGTVDARLSTMNADGFNIGAYGGWTDGPFSLAGSLAYAANRISTERRIVFGAINQTASADYWSHTIGFSGEAAYGLALGGGTTVSPLFTLDAGWSGHGGFTETDVGALNLTGASESWTRLDTGLGLAVSHVVLTETGKMTLDGRLLWEHAFADVVASQNLAFAGSPTGFTVNGPDAGRDRLRLGLGVSFEATEDMTIRANYSGLFSGSQQSHGASLGINVKF